VDEGHSPPCGAEAAQTIVAHAGAEPRPVLANNNNNSAADHANRQNGLNQHYANFAQKEKSNLAVDSSMQKRGHKQNARGEVAQSHMTVSLKKPKQLSNDS